MYIFLLYIIALKEEHRVLATVHSTYIPVIPSGDLVALTEGLVTCGGGGKTGSGGGGGGGAGVTGVGG